MHSRLWDRRSLTQAALSLTVGAVVALSVGAARGDLASTVHPSSGSVSQSRTDTTMPTQRG